MNLLEAATILVEQYAKLSTKEQRNLLPLLIQIHKATKSSDRQSLCKQILIQMHLQPAATRWL